MNLNLFLPKEYNFFDYFKDLAVLQKEEAIFFKEFASSFEKINFFSEKAKEVEHRADQKTHEIIDKLNKTFITPFDREDIYLLAHEMDDTIDLIENVMHNIKLYNITEKKQEVVEFSKLIVEASRTLHELIVSICDKKTTFKHSELVIKIHTLEDEGDSIYEQAMSNLFKNEKDTLMVIKWKDIFENLENVMDKYQKVSDIVEGIIVKSA